MGFQDVRRGQLGQNRSERDGQRDEGGNILTVAITLAQLNNHDFRGVTLGRIVLENN